MTPTPGAFSGNTLGTVSTKSAFSSNITTKSDPPKAKLANSQPLSAIAPSFTQSRAWIAETCAIPIGEITTTPFSGVSIPITIRVCGSLVRLSAEATAQVTEDDVLQGTVFDRQWLAQHKIFARLTTRFKASALPKPLASALEILSPVRRTWSGSNASAFRNAIIAVNGFDEQMKYGGEDKEFGVRLKNSGVKGRHLRFTAPLIHLDHKRGYVDPARIADNRARIADVRKSGRSWTPNGLEKAPE